MAVSNYELVVMGCGPAGQKGAIAAAGWRVALVDRAVMMGGVSVEKVPVACGARPAPSPQIAFDDHRVIDTDHLSGFDIVADAHAV